MSRCSCANAVMGENGVHMVFLRPKCLAGKQLW